MEPLIVVGASVRALASSVVRAGFLPLAIDCYADRDLPAACPATRIANYPRDFLQALEAAPAAPWMYTGGLENHPRLIEEMARIRPLLGNRGDVVRQVRSPVKLAAAAPEAGLSFPPIQLPAGGRQSLQRSLPERGPGLVKSRHSSGGLGVRLAKQNDWDRPRRGTYLQQYVEGQAVSAVYLAAGGRAMLVGGTRQLVGRDFDLDRPFLYCGSIGPMAWTSEEMNKLVALGEVLARRFKLVGLFNVDFVRTDNELWVLEVNPRYSASVEVLERLGTGPLIGWHVAACDDGRLPSGPIAPADCCAGKGIVYARAKAVVGDRFERLVEEWNRPGQPPGIADLPRVGDEFGSGQPVATVLAKGSSDAVVEAKLRERVAAVEQVLSTEY